MNGLVYHIVSGQSYFTGIALLLLAAFASTRTKPVFRRVTVLSFLIGVIAIAVSSTAIPYRYYGGTICAVTAWIASRFKPGWRRNTAMAMAGTLILSAVIEIPHLFTQALKPVRSRMMTVIGDSVTAGVDGDEKSETWPRLLARQHQINVQDISHIGETAASALKRAEAESITSPVIVVEIGGNDILGSTSTAEFARDLDALLTFLESPNRQVVMFELPLPPFCHEFGYIQRNLAAKHNVILIPKRVFLSVIASSESTLDTIHLSQSGHQLMADAVWKIIESAYVKSAGKDSQ